MAKQGLFINFRPKEICIIDSVYTLLLYLIVKRAEVSDILFLFHLHIPNHLAEHFQYVRSHSGGKYLRSRRYIFQNYYHALRFHFFMLINKLYGLKAGGNDHLPLSRRLINRKECYFEEYEDGSSNYSEIEGVSHMDNTPLNRFLLMDVEQRFGRSVKVKKVYLTHSELTPPVSVRNKVEWVDLKASWESLPDKKRKWILDLYKIPAREELEGRHIILMTRPFSEFFLGSEEEKVKSFMDSLENVDKTDLIVKPHYIETTDYKKFFPECVVIKGQFPIELLCLAYGSIIKQIITIGNCSAEPFFRRYYPEILYTKIQSDRYDSF